MAIIGTNVITIASIAKLGIKIIHRLNKLVDIIGNSVEVFSDVCITIEVSVIKY